jgi:hypothetical protein
MNDTAVILAVMYEVTRCLKALACDDKPKALTIANSVLAKIDAVLSSTSEDWDEKGDATRCDEGISDTLDIVENAVPAKQAKK